MEEEVEKELDEFEAAWNEDRGDISEPKAETVEEPEAETVEEPEAEIVEEPEPEPDAEFKGEFEAAQAKIKELEHSVASGNGRVSALTRKLYESNSPPAEDKAPAVESDTTKWNSLKEEYPDIADGTAEKLDAMEARVERMVEERLAPIRKMEEERYVDSQVDIVSRAYPEWQDTINTDGFTTWLDDQPLKVQDLKKSFESEDYIYLLKCYNGSKSEQVAEIKTSRENVLKSNVAVPKRGRTTPSGPPDDFESAFAYFANKD